MQKLLIILAGLVFVFLPTSLLAESDSKSSVYAVSFHADWCGSCQVLGPQVEKARGKANLDNQNVLFVKLDLTDETKRHQSMLMAEALGIGEYYKTNGGKTGFLLLVNSKDGKTIEKITKASDAGEIASKITGALGSI